MYGNIFRVFFAIFLFVVAIPAAIILESSYNDFTDKTTWKTIMKLSIDSRSLVFLLPLLALIYFVSCLSAMFVLITQIMDGSDEAMLRKEIKRYKLELAGKAAQQTQAAVFMDDPK